MSIRGPYGIEIQTIDDAAVTPLLKKLCAAILSHVSYADVDGLVFIPKSQVGPLLNDLVPIIAELKGEVI